MDDTEDFREISLNQMLEFFPDQEQLIRFECPNAKCFYATTDSTHLFRHKQSCRSKTIITCKQTAKGRPDNSVRLALERENIIPDSDWQNWHFCCYDVECFMEPKVDSNGQSKNVHRLVSIAVKSSFGDNSEFYIERNSMDPQELKPMMEKFRAHLTDQREEMLNYIPDSVIRGQKEYQDLRSSENFKFLSVAQQNKIKDKLRYLNDCLKLRIFSWNGERYDNNVVWAPLLDNFQHFQKEFEKMHIIRRGTGIMQFTFGHLVFRDFLNFSSPMSLDSFSKSCGVTETEKTVYPYELYQDISTLRTETAFPPYPLFKSSLQKVSDENAEELIQLANEQISTGFWKDPSDVLKFFQFTPELELKTENDIITAVEINGDASLTDILHTSPKKYFNSKKIFDDSCENMSQYLERYNLNDVVLLEQCVREYAKGFWETWQVNIHNYMSLPSVAQGKRANYI